MTTFILDFVFGNVKIRSKSVENTIKHAEKIGVEHYGKGTFSFDCIIRSKEGYRIQKEFFINN